MKNVFFKQKVNENEIEKNNSKNLANLADIISYMECCKYDGVEDFANIFNQPGVLKIVKECEIDFDLMKKALGINGDFVSREIKTDGEYAYFNLNKNAIVKAKNKDRRAVCLFVHKTFLDELVKVFGFFMNNK